MRRRIIGYAAEEGRDFSGLPCSLYYNININEDREAAIEESRRYLNAYYEPQVFSREAVEGWVACGSPEQCIAQLQGFVDAGATDILLRFPSWDQAGQFRRCVDEVLPRIAGAVAA
jgi:alkanesulfonate monooxygenase SsuD/methylene tetrahydromethanopterin reductase-like flavin-dependent oxidoreductase (luciferase family)